MSQSEDDRTRTCVPLTNGTVVSHYRIIEKIGAGGMGEVYRAEDTNLSRQVAVKVLPDLFGGDAERLARFEREAKLLAALNHPNLATVYGFESVEGKRFLVMEMVEGETLAERIAKGPLPLDEALDVFRQMAAGMEAAHEKGIIHRDLKPANIKITPEGKVKILDFGLAKALNGETVTSDLANSPTITENMTRAGVILGTAAYMSPEQAKGRPVDKRTDIWAFGCIVYECLTGKRAFEGVSTSETLAAVLRGEPNWDKLPAQTPSHIQVLLRRCLQKDSTKRLRDIGDALMDASDSYPTSSDLLAKRRRSWRTGVPWAAAALLLSVVAYLLYAGGERRPIIEEPTISSINPPANSVSCFRDGFALSPDGRKLAFVSMSSQGERLLWLRSLDRQDAAPLIGTDNAGYPFWSHDGKQIAFFAGGQLKRVPAEGGLVQTICRSELGRWGGCWGSGGVILFAGEKGISKVAENGGEPTYLGLDGVFPAFLPDGRRFLYVRYTGTKSSACISSLDNPNTSREIDGTDGVGRVELVAQNWLLLYQRIERTIEVQRVNLEFYSTLGNRKALAERVPVPLDWPTVTASPTSTIAFVSNPPEARNDLASRLIWVDRKGNQVGSLGEVGGYWHISISPDGQHVAVSPDDDIRIFDVSTGLSSRLTNEMALGGQAGHPRWSPDGDQVLALTWSQTKQGLVKYPICGGQPQGVYLDSNLLLYASDWSRNGRFVALDFLKRGEYRSEIAYWDFSSARLEMFIGTPSDEWGGHFSPDGRWMAYTSDETGSYEIYVRSFPDGTQVRRISPAGGTHPRWRADGRELFFLGPGWKVMSVDMKLHPDLEIGTPKPLFQMVMADIARGLTSPYDVSPDGQKFLVISPQTKPVPLTLVQNWQALADR